MISFSPHHLRLFTKGESWMLLKENVFREGHCPQELKEIGKQIARKCGGLPLTIILIASLLAKHDKEIIYWQEVGESLKPNMQGCMDIIESSYQQLPIHLKKCFLYFASFLEDQKVPVKKLIRLWIAENFVEASTGSKSLEMIAMDYLMDLIRSNLVMVAKRNSLGDLKAVNVHDLIYEFSLKKATYGDSLLRIHDQLVAIYPSSNGSSGHLNIVAPACEDSITTLRFIPSVYSPLVDLDLTRSWKHLRVLDFSSVKLDKTLIEALQYLIHLKYLELRYFSNIPDPIFNLKELETFIVTGTYRKHHIPNSIWDMSSLRHLHISRLHTYQLLQDLDNLKTCTNLVINAGEYYQKFMKRLPNLEKLSCRLRGKSSIKFFPAFGSLIQLKSLKIGVSESAPVVDPYGFEDFIYPSNLKELTLSSLELPWSKISTIGRLSILEVLKLKRNSFTGRQWDIEDGDFPNLKVLKLTNLGFSEWTASDDSYPKLEQVVMQSCLNLKGIPESFGSKCTMQLIEVRSCPSIESSALKIKEMQIDEMGNSEFKVNIRK
ncbi:putative late blight resistance protein homolog R1A-10 [Lycium barbarum]|uniref:putative late blight resistance protein homolog R1A-10 n=1 Tax=Lycium barbarum TaxID=112863 RepID=UPI00293E6185|nr:putative late blight resistance protein homolog R1A-10 [Lycium barbarum]